MELLRFQNSFYSFNLLSLIKLESQRVWISCGILCVCLLVHTCQFTCLWRPGVDGFWVPSSGAAYSPPPISPRQAPSLSLELPDWSVWPVSSRDSCPCVLSTSIRGVFFYHLTFYPNAGRSEFRPQPCVPAYWLSPASEGSFLTSALFALKAVHFSLAWWSTPFSPALGSQSQADVILRSDWST